MCLSTRRKESRKREKETIRREEGSERGERERGESEEKEEKRTEKHAEHQKGAIGTRASPPIPIHGAAPARRRSRARAATCHGQGAHARRLNLLALRRVQVPLSFPDTPRHSLCRHEPWKNRKTWLVRAGAGWVQSVERGLRRRRRRAPRLGKDAHADKWPIVQAIMIRRCTQIRL